MDCPDRYFTAMCCFEAFIRFAQPREFTLETLVPLAYDWIREKGYLRFFVRKQADVWLTGATLIRIAYDYLVLLGRETKKTPTEFEVLKAKACEIVVQALRTWAPPPRQLPERLIIRHVRNLFCSGQSFTRFTKYRIMNLSRIIMDLYPEIILPETDSLARGFPRMII